MKLCSLLRSFSSLTAFIAGGLLLVQTPAKAQTDPTPFALSGGNFSFTELASTTTAGASPANMSFWITGTTDQALTGTPTGNYTGTYNASSASRFTGLGANGISMVVTSSAGQGRPHSVVVGLNSTGRSDVQVSWTGGLVAQGDGSPTPRAYGLRLQYKIAAGGTWTSVAGPVEYLSTGQTAGHSQTFGPTTLPAECNDKPAVFVRWIYYSNAANSGGSRPQLRLDDISVTSTAASSTAPTIATQPASQTIFSGATATLSVVANGSAPLAYQWYQGTTGTTTTMVGTDSASFTTPALTTSTNYWVRVSNGAGSADSNTATISISTATTDLSSLALSGTTLMPTFAAETLAYTASVPNPTSSITLTPTAVDAMATITVNGTPVASGAASGSISLNVGENIITTVVSRSSLPDKAYTVTVTRAPASNNANLSALTLGSGSLSPAFTGNTISYLNFVPNATTSATVTPTVAEAGATVTVNGTPVISGAESSSISLLEGINTVSVVVTAPDNTTTKSYTVSIVRQAAGALTPGAIAFTGYNADGNDDLAFVALQAIPQNTVIFFVDEEWNGTDWAANSEATFAWVAGSNIVAGSVVTLNDLGFIYSTPPDAPSSNLGTILPVRDSGNGAGLGASDEAVFAFQSAGNLNAGGVPVPSVFLSVIANEDIATAVTTLTGTGLSEAAGTAIIFTGDEDGMRYKGPRSGLNTHAGYLTLLADKATNWDAELTDGTLYLPFDTTPFLTVSQQLVVTEVASNTGGDDFWELTNVGSTPVAIGNWKWDDESRNPADAAAVTIPAGTSIAAGESIIFTPSPAATFRGWWGALPGIQIISGGPGFGMNDAIFLFTDTGTEVLFFSYAASGYAHAGSGAISPGFIRSNGSGSAGGHAGVSAGGAATQSVVIDPTFGILNRRYAAATAGTFGAYASTFGGLNVGSPGVTGLNTSGPSVTLTLSVTPSTFSENASNPVALGTVTRAVATTSDLVVTLSSSDTTEATVPATVTILANQTSATFDVSAVNDTFPDGSKIASITATATDSTTPTFDVTVQDDGDVLDTSFMLTEVQSNQSAGSPATSEDYWELTNIGSTTKDISGYSWHDNGRSGSAAAAYKLPAGTSIAPGESVIFTAMPAADFKAWWNLAPSVQVFQSIGAPGLGQNDGISFFDAGQNELFFFSYAAAGFTKEDGSPSTGTHAGPSAGGSAESQALIWVPSSGTSTHRYTFASGSNYASYTAVSPATDTGSPGNKGMVIPTVSIGNASVVEGNSGSTTLALIVTRSDTDTAFTVDYVVTGGTATSGSDYTTLASGTLSFTSSGSATLPINISVTGDTLSEPDETILLTLSNVTNTVGTTIIQNAVGTGTITNDDVIPPLIATQPASTTIGTGSVTTLTVAASGFPTPTFQWYLGNSGDLSNPISGATSASFVTPVLTATTSYWVRASNSGGNADSNTATVTVVAGVVGVDLTNYVRVGRYDLPEPTRTALPPGTPAHNLLCQEASGVAYNWDTDTLFIACDGGRSITQVSKTGALIDTMTLALGSSPQGTDFYDIEGITYIGGGQFVMSEERDRQLVKFTYVAGTTLTRSGAQTVKIGTFVDNTGTEGLSYDPQTGGFICLKEISPIGIFQTGVDFAAGTATNGSASTVNSIDLFNPALLGMTDVADVFALSNLPSITGQPQAGNLLVLGQEDARIVNVDRSGNILSTLNITSDVGNPLNPAGQQHEGIVMDRAGIIYIVNENGGGSIDFPQLWVYAPASQPNQAPTAVVLNNAVNSIQENSSTASALKVGDIVVTDDGLGTNVLSLTGADVASFEIVGTSLFLKAGTVLDFETKTSFSVTIQADDTTVGSTPDVTVNYTLTVTDQVIETPPAPALIISEVAPWSSSNSPGVLADWFEVTNVSANPVDITGWKVDDSSAAFGTALALNGITTIAPGESVIFIETADLAGKSAAFKTTWFGSNPPPGLQIGSYTGSGIGLSTSGDGVNLFNAAGVLQSSVSFGAAPTGPSFATFDNTLGLNATTISTLSAVNVNGAFVATTSANEIGSPGYSAPGVLVITEVAPWGSGNSPYTSDWFEVTNIGARAVDMTGWRVDDSSESPAAALALLGVPSIAPGESVIFLETATPATTRATFLSTWFGTNPPATLQVGTYTGSGAGLSTGGDAVNLYDSTNTRRAKVFFAASPSSAPFTTFDNSAGADNVALTQFSAVGVNGAFVAVNDAAEVGSPGTRTVSGPTSFAAWLAANGYTGTIGGDTDNDGVPDVLEYYFNANPNDGTDRANLPQVVINGSDLEFRFTYLTGTAIPGYLQSSEDLTNWVDATPGVDYEVITETVNGPETTVRFRIFCNPIPTVTGPFTYLTPFTAEVERGSINNLTITNHGMVGAGRLSGDSYDSFGETMGAASGLSITGWSYNAGTGQFSGTFNVLPDRGYNSGAIFSNYAARVHQTPFTFTPYYGAGPVAQTQIVPTYSGTTKFTYLDGATTKFTTGLNPTGTSTLFGQQVGTVPVFNLASASTENLMSFDAEAIHVFPDGSGFVSDEYGTYICRFNSAKQFTRIIQLPASAQPHRPVGVLNFDSVTAPTNGRRNNQGLEGMAVSPDNTRLFALMQSALVQDGAAAQTRFNTRLYVYDIAGANLENPVLLGEYVVQLPRYDLNGNNSGLDATAAQSEIVALSNTQFLMLPRDGNGLGKGTTDPIVTKTVDLVDFTTASNVLGLYDAEGNQISPSGTLRAGIIPATSTVVVNLLSSADLAKFGFNTNTSAPNQFTVNEKAEGMALVPDTSTASTEDYFLFVANDNDFQSSDVRMIDATGALVSYGDARDRGITNDAVFSAWRITICPNNRKFFRIGVD